MVMDELLNVKRSWTDYVAKELFFIHVEFSFRFRNWKLFATFQEGHVLHSITDIYELGYKKDFSSSEDIEYLKIHKLEVFNKVKSQISDVILAEMNRHEELHKYRVEWLVS